MDLRLLEHFLRVAELGSLNRAALELGLSQPVLSRSISQLERDVGRPLVRRTHTGVTLTEAGAVLVARAPMLLREAEALREELAEETASRVILGLPAGLRDLVSLPALRELTRASRGFVRVHEGLNVFIRDMLTKGVLDLAILAVDQVPEADFDQRPVVTEPLVLVRRSGLPAPSVPVSPQELAAYPMVLPGRPNIIRSTLENELRLHGLSAIVQIEAEHLELCIEMVRAGVVDQTVTISSAVAQRPGHGLTVAATQGLSITWCIAVQRQRQNIPAVRRLRTLLYGALRKPVEKGIWPGARLVKSDEG